MSQEYEIEKITDLLELTDDQIDRLCAELPAMIKQVKSFVSLLGHLAGQKEKAIQALSPVVWMDDGREDLHITVSDENESASISFLHEKSNH